MLDVTYTVVLLYLPLCRSNFLRIHEVDVCSVGHSSECTALHRYKHAVCILK